MNGDQISRLPMSPNAQLNPQELALANHIFGSADSKVNRSAISNSIKSPLIVALIVAVMLHPASDQLVLKLYPSASENPYTVIAIKMAIAALVFYIVNNWALVRA
jgi:hypothetical protein